MMDETVEQRLEELDFKLPVVPKPVAEYVPAKHVGDLVYVSGQGPIRDGKPVYVGQVGAEVTREEGYEAAQICALNGLAAVKALVGSLEQVEEVVQVRGFVNSAPHFHEQPKVVNGASELLVKVFGERGRHARAALGTSNLPGNIPVEIEMIIRTRS
ncbi:RidA family protein [Candidatus Bipolaricaulota bacterium]|nr:RidA family protein [Candidatus Bipolaricaulota bacterium]